MTPFRLFLIVCFTLIFSNHSNAQFNINGTVTDSEFNPIANALVEIIDEDDTTNYYSANTDPLGNFNISGITDVLTESYEVPKDYIVLRNYPNPFNPSTIIYFELPKAEKVEIKIYDILGREVRSLYNNVQEAGVYQINWDGRNNWNHSVSAGIYLCWLKTEDHFKVHKMILLDGGSTPASIGNFQLKKTHKNEKLMSGNTFNFSIRVSGNSILESDFQHLSCSGDTTINLKVPKLLKTATIGIEGGELETENCILTIPASTFKNSEDVYLYQAGEENIYSENRITNTYIIDGIPRDFGQDLTLKIKYNKEPEGESLMAVGIKEYIVEKEESRIMYDLVDAEISSGYITTTINPINSSNLRIGKSSDSESSIVKYAILFGTGLSRMSTYTSKSTVIKYNAGLNDSKIALLGDYFDEAVKYFSNIGLLQEFFFGENKSRKIPITIIEDKKTTPFYDYLTPLNLEGVESINNSNLLEEFENVIKLYKINLNEAMFNSASDDDLSSLAAEGIYRFVRLISIGSNFNWFDWACIYWIRREFSLNVLPSDEKFAKGPNLFQPFYGMEAGKYHYKDNLGNDQYLNHEVTILATRHGVGMAPFITFIMNNYNPSGKLLFKIFDEITKNKNYLPTDFLLKSMNAPEYIWWPHFFNDYLLRYIFNISANDFLTGVTSIDEIVIENKTDTLKMFDRTYRDLSAKLCKILITDEIKNTQILNFKIGPKSLNFNYVKVLIFGLKDGYLTYVSEGTNFNVGELHLYDALVACVVNSGNELPYTGTNNIELSVGIAKESLFNYGIIKVNAPGIYTYFDGSTNSGTFRYIDGKSRSGLFDESMFISEWNLPYSNGTSRGRLEIIVDLTTSPPIVTDYYVTETIKLSDTETIIVEGDDVSIPGTMISDSYYQFTLSGTIVCSNIDQIYNRYDGSDAVYWWEFNFNQQCESSNYIQIYLGKE